MSVCTYVCSRGSVTTYILSCFHIVATMMCDDPADPTKPAKIAREATHRDKLSLPYRPYEVAIDGLELS